MRLFAPLLTLALAAAPAARAAEFVGAESCRSCHAAAYDAWKGTAHARAMGSLTPDQQKDGRCVQCHARDTLAGGDPGVTCETCHGAGGFYWPSYVMRDAELARAIGLVMPDAKACLVCHDAGSPSLEPFDPAAKMALIDHWTAARNARKAKKAEACPRPPAKGFLARTLPARAAAKDAAVVAAHLARSARR